MFPILYTYFQAQNDVSKLEVMFSKVCLIQIYVSKSKFSNLCFQVHCYQTYKDKKHCITKSSFDAVLSNKLQGLDDIILHVFRSHKEKELGPISYTRYTLNMNLSKQMK